MSVPAEEPGNRFEEKLSEKWKIPVHPMSTGARLGVGLAARSRSSDCASGHTAVRGLAEVARILKPIRPAR